MTNIMNKKCLILAVPIFIISDSILISNKILKFWQFFILIVLEFYSISICCKSNSTINRNRRIIPSNEVNIELNPIIYSPIDNNLEINNLCTICLDENTENLVELSCSHIFHLNCIEEWHKRKNTCPNCRIDMTKELENTELNEVVIQINS